MLKMSDDNISDNNFNTRSLTRFQIQSKKLKPGLNMVEFMIQILGFWPISWIFVYVFEKATAPILPFSCDILV